MKKKLLSLALVLVMALTLLPTAAFAEGEDVDLDNSTQTPVVCTGDPDASDCPAATHIEGCPKFSSGGARVVSCPHSSPTHFARVEPSCATPGNIEYWQCNSCGEKSSNAAFTTKVTDVEIAPTGHTWDTSGEPSKCTKCNVTCVHAADLTGTCPTCKKDLSVPSDTPHTHTLTPVAAKAASCTEAGNNAYYSCACGKYFSDAAGAYEIRLSDTVISAKGHTPPTDGTGKPVNSSTHTYTCTTCHTDNVSGTHINNSSGKCTVCGFEGGSSGGSTTNPSYRYIDISSAYVGDYSISVTWTSDLPSGTYFDIYVDGGFRTTVAPSKSSGYFSYTVDFSHYLGDSYYTVAVYARDDHAIYDSIRTYNRYYDHDYWYPDHWYPNSTPSTNSYGIPNASQVNGRYSAAEAIRILRGKNQYNLQNDLMSSSSALDSFERLERAVKDANHVSVNVSSSRSGVPSVFRSGVSITGAAFNASSTNSTVSLVLDAPSVNRYAGRGYQFSMSLTGVGGDSSLDVPVIVSLPLPSDISPNFVKVLHYHNSNTPTVITPQVSGGKIRFPLTGFSDFVVTDGGVPNYTYVSDGYGGYYVPVGTVARQSLVDQHLAAVLPIIAANAANGYIFDDVSGTYWAAPQIAWVKDGGLMTGYYDGTFRPYSGTTRQELWMVLARLAGANPADMWAAREWAMNVGITDGTNPYAPLSNQQMITMLYRYASYRRMNLTAPTTMLSIYHDSASVSPYARTPMAWAINQGIVTGNGTGYLYPQNIATRADFAVYLYRFLQ